MEHQLNRIKDLISQDGAYLYVFGCKVCFIGPKNDRGDVEQNPHCVGLSNHRCNPAEIKLYVRQTDQFRSWVLIRERRADSLLQICGLRNCHSGVKCQKAHSEEEKHIWNILVRHRLFVYQFLNLVLNPEDDKPPDAGRGEARQNQRRGENVAQLANGPRRQQARGNAAFAPHRNSPQKTFNKINANRFKSVLSECQGGRFLLVCKECYNIEPRLILEMSLGRRTHCPWCNSRSELLMHETRETNAKGVVFNEYQNVRKRQSVSRGNRYCMHLHNCYAGEACKYVHSNFELQVWEMEAQKISRLDLALYCRDTAKQREATQNGVFHCSFCCLNFGKYEDYSKHIKCDLHVHMKVAKQKDVVWKYRRCPDGVKPALCDSDSCYKGQLCPNAHSERELEEWRQRINYVMARNGYSLAEPIASYIVRLQKRMQEEELMECENAFGELANKVIQILEERVNWTFKVPQTLMQTLKHMAFLQPIFKLKRENDRDYQQHLLITTGWKQDVQFKAEFTNPKVFGHYCGTLVFDFGEGQKLRLMSFNVTICGSDMTIPQLEVLKQDWTGNRIIIKYPEEESHERAYEENVKKLQNEYPVPQKETLDDIYLENLSPSDYAKQMHTFLYKEEIARQDLLSRLNIECNLTMMKTFSLASSGMHIAVDGYLYACFKSPSRLSADSDEGMLARDSCRMVLIGEREETAKAYQCKIEDWEHDEVYINLSPRCIAELGLEPGQQRALVVQYQLDRTIFCLRHYAVDNLKERIALICPSKKTCPELINPLLPPPTTDLDASQNLVLRHMRFGVDKKRDATDKCYPPLVVAGPFGTGKTFTIRRVIRYLLEGNGKNTRILLCTKANSAADLYIKDICDDPSWNRWKSTILRVMYHGRNPRTVLSGVEVLDFCLRDPQRGVFRYPSMSEVRKYQLVITTFPVALALGALGTGLHANAFTHIFLDEASQAMEPEVIMPLTLASTQDTRIIIAGDHRQINERLYLSDDIKVPTLLERMYDAYEDVNPGCRVILNNNYRCVKGLLDLISELFYKEDILNNAGDAQCIPGIEPVQFVHVQGDCQKTHSGEFVNDSEAEQIIYCLQELVKVVDPREILVTAPYYQQVRVIREKMKANRLRVTVYPARNLQGLQYKIVILSCVLRRVSCLSCVGENFGFLSDPNLLNTVLTRAKSLVIAVGDAVTLCSTGRCEKKWKTFIKHCEDTGTIHPPYINVESIKNEIRLAKHSLNPAAQEFLPAHMKPQQQSDMPEVPPGLGVANKADIDEENPDTETDNLLKDEDYDSDADSWISDDTDDSLESDNILNDMVKKAMGYNPNHVKVDVDAQGREKLIFDDDSEEEEDFDPNEVHNQAPPRSSTRRNKVIYPKLSIKELEELMKQFPKKYLRCKIHIKNWFTAKAVPVEFDSQTSEDDDGGHVIHLNTKPNLGRTFDNDEVVVKILEEKRSRQNPDGKVFGQVMGITKRHENPRHRYYLCRPDEYSSGIMSPMDPKMSKFAIVTPKGHAQMSPLKIPVYRLVRRRTSADQYAELKLVSKEKVDWNNAYAIRYLRWSEYCPYPLGYVERVVPIEDHQQCLALEFGIPTSHKPSTIKNAKKLHQPENRTREVIPVITIDPEGSRDLDDALSFHSCTEHPNCKKIGVHITDVASVIPAGHPVDKAARKQKSSFYQLPKIMHMLPEELSIDKCSILPDKERAAISTFFHTSLKPPHLDAFHFVTPERKFIKSVCQLTYKQAEDLMKEAKENKSTNGEQTLGRYLFEIWRVMWDWRVARLDGAAFTSERKLEEVMEEGRAHLLIEEAMLSVNANAAKYLTAKGYKIPLKSQEPPDTERWWQWRRLNVGTIRNSSCLSSYSEHFLQVRQMRHRFTRDLENQGNVDDLEEQMRELDLSPQATSDDKGIRVFKKFWHHMMTCRDKNDLTTFVFLFAYDDLHPSQIPMLEQSRSMQNKAISIVPHHNTDVYHYSLRIPKYVKSSSPIRRYTDIVVQRCIHRALKDLAPSEDMTKDMEKINWDLDRKIRTIEQKFEMAELARNLIEQPRMYIVCISMVTDAYIKVHFPSYRMPMSVNAKQLDYSDLMIDMGSKDLLEGMEERDIRRTDRGDIILGEVDVTWKLRYYNYLEEQQVVRTAKKLAIEKFDSETVMVPAKLWRNLVEVIRKPPLMSAAPDVKKTYHDNLRKAVQELRYTRDDYAWTDRPCGQTRNNPVPLYHHREIKNQLSAGLALRVQLSSWSSKDRLPEPCIQLLSVAEDLDVCVHHNREPLHVFAYDARTVRENDGPIPTIKTYRWIWEPLVRLDAAYNAVKDGSSVTIDKVKISWDVSKESTGEEVAQSNSTQAVFPSQDAKNCFKLNYTFCRERFIDLHRGDLLCLRLKGVPNSSGGGPSTSQDNSAQTFTAVLHGIITNADDRKARKEAKAEKKIPDIKIHFKIFDQYPDIPNFAFLRQHTNLWTIEVLQLDFMHRHMQYALWKLADAENTVTERICLRKIAPADLPTITIPDVAERLVKSTRLVGFPYDLNERQQQQKERAIRNPFTVIQGPPGTGKSFMGAQIAATFSYINKMNDPEKPKKVLYCGPSNKSVDVAAGFLKNIPNLKVVRMYSTALEEKLYPNPIKPARAIPSPGEDSKMPDENLENVALHNLVRLADNPMADEIRAFDSRVRDPRNSFTRKEIDAYAAAIGEAKKYELEKCDIIVCTCSLSTQLSEFMKENQALQFEQCIVDECGMCSEPETLLPLVTASPSQVVLIGDHKQLQPVIKCRKAERLGLGISLFSKYSEMAGMLTKQYRMHPTIMCFPSEQFYDDKLECAEEVLRRPRRSFYPHHRCDESVFWHVVGEEKVQQFKSIHGGEKSKYNLAEARLVVQLLVYLTNNAPSRLRPASIMVLSPYTAQCARIREIIVKSHNQLKDVHVGTIVTSQGSEADYVILSTVRSLPDSAIGEDPNIIWQQKNLGFVCDEHQVNVALTRARYGLCIIGNKNLLETNLLWKRLIQSFESQDALHDRLL